MIYCFLIDFNEISGTPNNSRPILSQVSRTLKPKNDITRCSYNLLCRY